ncbi:hypothetical protein [uncultured Intestinimonas sp.]|uniref:hypothetical protein n=1 Tax=uncultured Intestinimonas sp. TaxID=1689265 RepID=UPI0025D04084|nr:hypothetical protein [uncultured Intestinimonas sp.]
MSAVTLLCADRPLPLYGSGLRRMEIRSQGGDTVRTETEGFAVRALDYYRPAVEALGLDRKPCPYELNLCATEEDAAALRAYLERNCAPGEAVELWRLWVGVDREARVPCFRGKLSGLDAETLEQLAPPRIALWQCRLTIEI